MVIRNDPVTVKHTKRMFTDVGKVMMAFILAIEFDFIAYMRKIAFFGKLFSRQWRFWNMMYFTQNKLKHFTGNKNKLVHEVVFHEDQQHGYIKC